MRALLTDFGVASILPLHVGPQAVYGATPGTLTYMPPEALQPPYAFSTSTDIWSLGILLWELWTQAVPFQGLSRHEVIWHIVERKLPVWPPKSPPLLEALAQHCWSEVRPWSASCVFLIKSCRCKKAAGVRCGP